MIKKADCPPLVLTPEEKLQRQNQDLKCENISQKVVIQRLEHFKKQMLDQQKYFIAKVDKLELKVEKQKKLLAYRAKFIKQLKACHVDQR